MGQGYWLIRCRINGKKPCPSLGIYPTTYLQAVHYPATNCHIPVLVRISHNPNLSTGNVPQSFKGVQLDAQQSSLVHDSADVIFNLK
jgi:hypothetical protein